MPQATPDPDTNIESVMSTCIKCKQPIASIKVDAGADWSPWAHALTGEIDCAGIPEPPSTETSRVN
jgi:hypothetical protein